MVTHEVHRHEPPVANLTVKFVREDDTVITVDEPGGTPVHPDGMYRYNAILHILKKEQATNRLDRFTSGLMSMALSAKKTRAFGSIMQKFEIIKDYINKAKGQLP
ncbi:hypothetical protein BGX34_001596, partial [Mortierella sp. NVP85]